MSDSDKSGSSFWSALDNFLRARPTSTQADKEPKQDKKAESTLKTVQDFDQDAPSDEIFKRLNSLKSSEPFENRLKSFEELIKLSELFQLNESSINNFLKVTSDLYKIDRTPAEIRIKAFNYLIQFYQKKADKFDSFMLRNHLLCFIIINCKKSKCIFLNALNQISKPTSPEDGHCSILENLRPSSSTKLLNDDLKLRLSLFLLVTKNGNYCKNLDPDLMSECLVYFLENSELLIDKFGDLFIMFKNLMTNKYFQYTNEQILTMLSRTILNFSYLVTASFERPGRLNQEDIKSCVDLIENLIENITSSVCINYVVLCLCELLDIVWQNGQTRTEVQLSRNEAVDFSDLLISQIYGCMSKLFVSPIGSYAVFTFFSEIFPISKKYQVHRKHQINGALMHIKKIFDEFKQSKSKNIYLIKELHINCLIYLPNALKSCCTEGPREQQLIIFKHIVNLTIDLVHLASHRDLFMCLLTYNSRKFLIEIVNQFSVQNLDDDELVKKYADLINLLDLKDVFSYKTSQKEPSSGQTLIRNPSSASLNSDNLEELSFIMYKFKEAFYDLVYKFPRPNYLKDNCINNCVDFYLQRKFLPIFGPQSIEGIKILLEKYLAVRNKFSIVVRKNLIEALHRKINEYFQMDHKSFIEQLVEQVLIAAYEITLVEEDSHFRSVPSAQKMDFIFDLFEIKYFVVTKLIELVNVSNDENNVLKIIKIFEKIIEMEKVSSVEMLVPHGLVFATVPNSSQMTGSFNNQLLLKHPNGNFSNCLSYLYKIITHGLIEIFEKYFHKACSLEIFNILVKYIEYYYLTQYSFNSANFFMSNNPSSLSSIAAESLPVQNQIEAQSNSKFFNYYSHIRKEIFDFLLRIRSNPERRVLLIDRVNRRKFIQSKYLMLNLCETKARFPEDFEQKNLLKCELDFGKILKMIEYCLDKEVDWHVITRLLGELPYVMQYEMDLIKISDFTYKLFKLLYKKDINVIRNKPENLSAQEYISKFYPLLASMVLYHSSFEKNSQENILQNLASGIHASRNLFCLEILTIAMTEMHETNANQCAELLLKLSQFSSSLAIAQPILELLSTISDFKKLHSVCATKEFIAVSATAIKYIDPFKFNPFIVLMAHYVLCAWFIKCKPESRKSYASFTSRGLYQEVIVQLDNKVNYREKKSPNKLPDQENLTNAQKRLSAVEPNQKNETKSTQSENHGSSRVISDNLKQFYRDLVEITMDFMSNNMNYDSSYLNQSSSIHNSGEFMADRFSSSGSLPGNYNQSGLFENKENKKNGQKTKLWLIGNKIIQITTGLFSNVCTEQEPLMSAPRNKNSRSLSKSKSVHSQAIDIPSHCGQNTESMASSNSSTSVSVTNSLSSNSKSDSTLAQVGDKSDQDIFDETIDASESTYNKKELVKPCESKLVPCGPKKNRLIKRRYKSGLPLTDRNDADSMEENILKGLNDNSNKLSKDDSVLNPDTDHFLPFCCIKNGHDINHHHHHHEINKGSELCNPNCWCNNLVEIKCRYPTKVVSFVSLVEPNFSNFHSVNLANFDKILKSHPFELSPEKLMKQNAIEMRRLNILARISESSASNDTPPNEKLDTEKKPNTSRKPSLDIQPDPDTNIFMSTRSQRSAAFNQCLDPSQVFLHLFQNQHFATEGDQPTLIPDNDAIKRSLNILDYYSCFWLHKIGVVYVGPNQAYDEKAILSNCSGSVRYRTFVNSLGNLICLRDMDTDQFYPGGLDTDGTVGDFAVIWFDGIIQVLFHIATLMLTEENTNSKKRHIGNDSTIIVYNESGEEYNFSMIKGEVNCVCIEIIPLKSNTNIVKVKTTSEMSQWLTYSDPKFVSDQNLGLIVRKMALHADIASKVFRSQKDGVVFYGGRFYDRLKQIKRIMKQAKESQKCQQPAKTGNESKSSFTVNSEKVVGQMDFLEYI